MNETFFHNQRSELSRKIITKCAATMIIYAVFIVFTGVVCWFLCQTRIWYEYDPLYHLLFWIQNNIILFGGTIIVAGWVFIFSFYIQKPLRYLDEIIVESQKLAVPENGQIRLSAELKNVQDELNLIREKAIASAAAAKEAEQRKNDLIVYLAHDLKTPLTSVIGYLSLLHDEPQISPQFREKYTDIALEKAERLEDLINEFFDITRFNLTHIELDLETINFSRMAEQTAFEFNPILEEKGLSWKLQIAPDVKLLCDADKMERVLDNLIRNAINYSYPNTEIELILLTNAASVIFSVKNHGKTIAKENLNRLFEQFFRLDTSRKTKTGGAGLGLAIAKEIVELHGGTIKAESADESVIFIIELPL